VTTSGDGCAPGNYITPATLSWTSGAVCTVSFASPQAGATGVQYVFTNWQDGPTSNARTIVAPGQASSYSATFKTQYLLTVLVSPPEGGTGGAVWCDAGSTAGAPGQPAAGYRLTGWSGATPPFIINSPVTVTANLELVPVPPLASYTFTTIATNAAAGSRHSINSFGQVVGSAGSSGATSPFLWTPTTANGQSGSLMTLPGAAGSIAAAINDRGQVVGTLGTGVASLAFLWSPETPNGTTGTTTPFLGNGAAGSTASAINSYGQIIGTQNGSGFFWTPSSANGSTGASNSDSRFTTAIDIDDFGKVVLSQPPGNWYYTPYLFTPAEAHGGSGGFSGLGTISGSLTGISANGIIIGVDHAGSRFGPARLVEDVTNSFGTVTGSGGHMGTEPIIPATTDSISFLSPTGVNSFGQVVGAFRFPSGVSWLPFLFANGVTYDLSVLGGDLAGGTPVAINDAGQIVVNANNDVYLLTPGAPAGAALTSPAAGSVLAGQTATFTWNAVAGAEKYWLDLGTGPAQWDLATGSTTATSKTVAGLQCDGRLLFAQLWTHLNGAWLRPRPYTFTACGTPFSQITSPTPGSILSTSATFNWTATAGATQYWLDVGNSVGRGDIFASASNLFSQTVNNLPCDGRTIYVQLYTQLNGVWLTPQRYTYTACSNGVAVAQITSPLPSTTLPIASVTFTWTSVANADQYWLDVGNAAGQGDISAGATTSTSRTVSGIPCDGRIIYVQLWTHSNGAWLTPQRYTYTASPNCGGATTAQITSPVPGSVLAAGSVTFSWTAAAGADQYWLDVGNTVGQGDISAGATTATSKAIANLPCDGRTLYVQLWTHLNGAWLTPQRSTFTAASCALAAIAAPAPNTALAAGNVNFTWSAASGADQYWLDVGGTIRQGDYFAGATSGTSMTATGMPCDGRAVYVQLFTHIQGAWQTPQRYTYTAASGCAALLAPAGSTLAGTSVNFTWSPVAGADQYWLSVGTGVGVGDIFAATTAGTSISVTNLPSDGRQVYVQLYTHNSSTGWMAPSRYMFTAWKAGQ
jgi:uncharacterized membrane protein